MKKMKKLFMILCVVIMFFGLLGCPSDSEQIGSVVTPENITKPATDQIDTIGDDGNNHAAVPEPATLILLGSGLVGLAGFARKKFKK
jgi:hypothetical protein